MSESQALLIESFNSNYLIVYKDKQQKELKKYEGEWIPKLNAWLIPKKYELKVKTMLTTLHNKHIFYNSAETGNRKNKKFHRDISDDESSSPDSPLCKKLSISKKILYASSSDDGDDDSEDSDFPEFEEPIDHEKEYQNFLKKQKELKKRN